MKRSGSDWYLDEFLIHDQDDGDDRRPAQEEIEEMLLPLPPPQHKTRFCSQGFGFIADHHRDVIGDHQAGGELTVNQIWSQSPNLSTTPKHSSISATIDSPTSLYTGSPTSSLKPKGLENQLPGVTSGSEQSDDDSSEIGPGSCGQSTNITDTKRVKRMVSNRESARRSRKRKQAHLADLESQVDRLRGEIASLYKQLTGANHEFTEAVTDNRVLKSDVETLRVKVKMAEDLVTRGSLACSLDHLLQSQISAPHELNTRNLCRASDVPPITDLQVNEDCYLDAIAATQVHRMGIEGDKVKYGNILNQNSPLESIATLDNLQSTLSNDISSCGADMWAWDSNVNVLSKQF